MNKSFSFIILALLFSDGKAEPPNVSEDSTNEKPTTLQSIVNAFPTLEEGCYLRYLHDQMGGQRDLKKYAQWLIGEHRDVKVSLISQRNIWIGTFRKGVPTGFVGTDTEDGVFFEAYRIPKKDSPTEIVSDSIVKLDHSESEIIIYRVQKRFSVEGERVVLLSSSVEQLGAD